MINLYGMKKSEVKEMTLEQYDEEMKRFNEGWYKGFVVATIGCVIGVIIGELALNKISEE